MPKRALYKDTADDPLGNRLYLTSYKLMRHAEQLLDEQGMTFHSYLILYYVQKIPRISMSELCGYMDVSQSIVSRTIQILVQKGLVKKNGSLDRRRSELSLTPEARKRLKKASGKLNELSFLLRHQPGFRIAAIEEQLDKINNAVAVAKERPILRTEDNGEPGESVVVRLTNRVKQGVGL